MKKERFGLFPPRAKDDKKRRALTWRI